MKRPSHCFALGFCLAAIAAVWGRSGILHAQLPPLPVCDCQSIRNSFPQNLNCVGDMTETVTCVANTSSATCTMSGTLWWVPTIPSCVVNSPLAGNYEPPYLWCTTGALPFHPGVEQEIPVSDTQPCPSPSDCRSSWPRASMQVAYQTDWGGIPACTNCSAPTKTLTGLKVYNCVFP